MAVEEESKEKNDEQNGEVDSEATAQDVSKCGPYDVQFFFLFEIASVR